jgi:FtsP/CotA-like multicopper oxidase with cupredoxin domain
MTRNQRIGLLAAALVVAVVAFVIAQSGGDDNDGGTSQPAASGGGSSQTTDTSTKPTVFRINVKGGVVDGDTQTFTVKKNDTVRIDVTSDAPDQIHLHGYDIEKEATPGNPARFKFKANVEGAFIIESHAAEDAGNEPLVARLHVEP